MVVFFFKRHVLNEETIMKSQQTLIIVAAEQDMRLFRQVGTNKALTEVLHLKAEEMKDVAVEFTAGRGRAQGGRAGGGGPAHGLNDAHPQAEIERGRFATHAVEVAAKEWGTGGYDRAILVAGPKMLGAMREDMPDTLRDAIVTELGKDLVNFSPKDIADHLQDVI
jgi:protein required for attachment to host cells